MLWEDDGPFIFLSFCQSYSISRHIPLDELKKTRPLPLVEVVVQILQALRCEP